MKYDKEIFKQHFGKPYIDGMIWYTVSALACLLLALVFRLFGLPMHPVVAFPLLIHFSLWLFPGLAVLYCYYIQALQRSKRQRQWFHKDMLYVQLVPTDGFVWGAGIERHKKIYMIRQVDSYEIKNTKIIVYGNILLNDNWNGIVKEKILNKFSIPRNFSGEKQLLGWLEQKRKEYV